MDSLVHHWKEINKTLMKDIFLFDDNLSDDHSVIKVWSLKTSHMSAVKALFLG